uniref:Uncharacterized protein n=1 Tax=Desulfomonile tiedjei TaxID=2358 RepID=A0A7C4ARK4_9BACT
MKFMSVASVVAVVLVLALGGWGHADEGKVTGGDVRKQAEETLDAAKKYALQQKAEYQQKVEQELSELGTKIAGLKEKAQTATGESLRALQEKMKDLKDRQAAAEKRLSELKSSTYQAWSEMRDGVDKAVSELKKAYDGAASLFK